MEGDDGCKANEQAYRAIRGAVVEGSLSADARLTEQGLAQRLGMSRTPVREAVRRLLAEGILSRDSGRGLRVTAIGQEDIREIFEIRLLLETQAARRAALHADAEECRSLRALAAEMEVLARQPGAPPLDAIRAANHRFHRLILTAARSPRLTAILSAVVDLALVARTFQIYAPADISRSAAHHVELAEAISAHAPDWAGHVMSAHLLAASRIMDDRQRKAR